MRCIRLSVTKISWGWLGTRNNHNPFFYFKGTSTIQLFMTSQDPRRLNHIFDGKTASAHFSEYRTSLDQALRSVPLKNIDHAFELIFQASQKGKKLLIAGNGGSAGISDHLSCDLGKGTLSPGQPPLKVLSLSANGPMLTAIANDYGYDEVFATQVAMYGEEGDVLITISSSGKSPNIVKSLEVARKMGLKTIALTGFGGGKSRELCDVSLHFEFQNYGIVEDCHQIVLQSIGQYLAKIRDGNW
ncbi:MAG: SIS domain-containing protein [Bdellovibrionales bacterium]|nr:SIS domain-containing protein [Bdellovibrionales bacterium]MBK9041578.1 SIS domain-containing protein [Bdellovibrionales bacterium]